MIHAVLSALGALRSPFVLYENDLHALVLSCLEDAHLPYQHEAKLMAGCRIDVLVGNVGIEIKKGKPSAVTLRKQLLRYATCEGVDALVVITERTVALPKQMAGKPVYGVVLSKQWGVSLP